MAKSRKPKWKRNVKAQKETVDQSTIDRVSQDTPSGHPDHEARVKQALRESRGSSHKAG